MSSELPINALTNAIDDFSIVSSGKVLLRNKYQVALAEKVQNSSYVNDESSGETTEISRDKIELNGETASISLGSMYETVSGVKTIQPVLKTTPTETNIMSISSDTVCNLTLDGSIAWDRDEACLYLAANKAFRFRYVESDGISSSRLVLEGYSESTSTYLPKVEFSRD